MLACFIMSRRIAVSIAALGAALGAASIAALGGVAALAPLAGCGRGPAGFHPAWPDAQVELRDDGDREQAIDRLWLVPPGPERERWPHENKVALPCRYDRVWCPT